MTVWRRAAAVTLVAALATAGCGRDSGEGGGSDEAAAESVSEGPATGDITVWAMGAEGENLPTIAEDFMAENPDANVTVTPVPWDAAHDKIATAIAGGETPDVSLVGTTWMGEFAETGALDPTPELIDPGAFFEGAWNTTVVDDTSYGIPWYVETRLLYYRTDLAEQAGVGEPETWEDLKALAAGMKEAGATWGINLQPGGTGSWQTFMPFAWQAGAEVLDGGEFALDSPATTEALEYYTSFFDEGLAPKTLAPGALESGFINGDIGAFISGPWHMAILEEQAQGQLDGKYAVAHMPEKERATSFVGGGDLVVFKDAQNRDGAWKFLEYLSRPEVQAKWYEIAGALPSVEAAWEEEALSGDEMLATFGEQLEDAKSPPAIPRWEQVASVIDAEIEKAVLGGASAEEAVQSMQQGAAAIGTGA